MNVLVLVGSLRAGSTNRQLADAAIAHLPSGVEGTVFARLAEVPHYSEDLDHDDDDLPEVARDLREAVADADALLLVTPEYNGSMSSAVKNAVDWASRPPEQPFDGKPIGILGASPGVLGSSRAQYHLRQCFVYLNGQVMNRPEVMIGQANSKFDAEGNLTDQGTADFLKGLLASFADHIRYHQRARSGS